MDLAVENTELKFTEEARRYLDRKAAISEGVPKRIRQEALRMAELIADRIARSGTIDPRTNRDRFGANSIDTIAIITSKWTAGQRGLCALCGCPLEPTGNHLLKASPDRIDSTNPSYDADNLQITHLGCNLAKNAFSNEQFQEWLNHVRAADRR